MTTKSSTPRRTRHTGLVCAALAGVTVILGALAPPSAARPDIGVGSGQAGPDLAGETAVRTGQSFVPRPTLLAGSMGVHVEGGWLLR